MSQDAYPDLYKHPIFHCLLYKVVCSRLPTFCMTQKSLKEPESNGGSTETKVY